MAMRATVQRLCQAITSHDPQRVADCFSSEYHCVMPMHPERSFVGSAEVLRTWTGMFRGLPDLFAAVLRAAVAGSETWSEWEMTGGTPTGTPSLIRGMVVWGEDAGAITWARAFYLDPVSDTRPAGPENVGVDERTARESAPRQVRR